LEGNLFKSTKLKEAYSITDSNGEKMKMKLMSMLILALFISGATVSGMYPTIEKESVDITLSFSKPVIDYHEEYTRIEVKEANSFEMSAGKPILPFNSTVLTFPFGTKIDGIDVKTGEVITKQLDKKIMPASPPIPLNMQNVKVEIKEGSIYESNEAYPSGWITYNIGAGIEKGKHVVFFSIHAFPCRYIPASNELLYTDKIEIKVKYTPPEKPLMQNDEYDLLIIAPSEFLDELHPLVEHKESCNITTKIVTLDEIYGSVYFTTQGRDDAERIKYFIKNAIEEWGIKYVLLVGNADKLPARDAYVNDGEEAYFISDLYYADIYDGEGNFASWDTNGNNYFAEYNYSGRYDTVDLYPDVYIGRLACKDKNEVTIVVNKIVSYETLEAYNEGWFNNIILVGGDTFTDDDNGIDEGEYVNQRVLDALRNFNGVKIWASNGGLSSIANIDQAFYEGAGFADFSGHGSPTSFATHPHGNDKIWLPPGFVKTSNVRSFVNRNKLPIIILNACSTCKFSRNGCFGWTFLSNPDGGGIATCGNTGLGWGYKGKGVTSGLCGLMELNSFKSYASGIETLGEMWKETLNRYLNKLGGSMGAHDHKTVEEWITFGDPSLKISSHSPPTNNPPEKPERPVGDIKGKIGKEYQYTTSSIDPDGDSLYYLFDWGDGSYSEWLGPYESGETVNASHVWEKRGTYEIKVKAKDEYGSQSNWSDVLVISMPKLPIRAVFDMITEWLLQFFGIKSLPPLFT